MKDEVIVKALVAKRDRLNALIAEFGGDGNTPSAAKRKGGKRTLSPEQIAKMQEGRRKGREAKENSETEATSTEEPAVPMSAIAG